MVTENLSFFKLEVFYSIKFDCITSYHALLLIVASVLCVANVLLRTFAASKSQSIFQLFKKLEKSDSQQRKPVLAGLSSMKRKEDLFEGLAEFDEEIPDAKRYKLSEDDMGITVEQALGPSNGADSVPRPAGALKALRAGCQIR